MNKTILVGNITKKPDVKKVGEHTVSTFTIAVNRRYKDRAGDTVTDFFNIVAWRKLAENCARYLDKGSKVGIVGELQTRSYEKDGAKRYITEILAEEVNFISKKSDGQSPEGFGESNGFVDIEDNDLPF